MGRSSYQTLLSLAVTLFSIILCSININNDKNSNLNAYGHTFSPNESASFLSFADQLQVESELVLTNLANDSITMAQEHANKASSLLTSNITTEIAEENQRVANELTRAINDLQNISSSPQQVGSVDQLVRNIEDILDEAVSTRIEQEDVENATIQALAFANLVNSILESYGNAYAVDFDMTNMSNMAMMGQSSNNMSTMTMSNMSTHSIGNSSNIEVNSMNMSSAFITNLENGLTQLNASIKNKASPMDIMMIVHTQIHPNLLEAFNLPLRQG
ncbi:hypothetical protein BH18THE2_BH18THE2_18850 [soil metagenome]